MPVPWSPKLLYLLPNDASLALSMQPSIMSDIIGAGTM